MECVARGVRGTGRGEVRGKLHLCDEGERKNEREREVDLEALRWTRKC